MDRPRAATTVTMVLLVIASGTSLATGLSAGSTLLEDLALESAGEGVAIMLRTSNPVPRFVCRIIRSPRREVVFEVPGATSRLRSSYALASSFVTQALVEPMAGDTGGVRVRLSFDRCELSSVEQVEKGVRLRFEPDPSFVPASDAPTASDYRVGVGDKLEIDVFGHEDLTKVVEVRGDGKINYPLVGDVQVAGKTVAQVDDEITRILGKDYLVDPQVSVIIKEYQSQWVTVIGEVKTPGRYVLKRDMRLIDLLAEAGGATKDAGSQILLTRQQFAGGGTRQISVNLSKLFSAENTEANLLLSHGDIVSLGQKEVFYIRGEVGRPGSYFLENSMTIMKAISVAGGFSQFANHREVELIRQEGSGAPKKTVINLKAIEDGRKDDVELRANDTIIVPRRIF